MYLPKMKTKDWLVLGGTAVVSGGIGWAIGRYMLPYASTPAAGDLPGRRLSPTEMNTVNAALRQMGLTCAQWKQLDFGWRTDAVHRYLIGSAAIPLSKMPYGYSPWPWYLNQPTSTLSGSSSPATVMSLSPSGSALLDREEQLIRLLDAACGTSPIKPSSSPDQAKMPLSNP